MKLEKNKPSDCHGHVTMMEGLSGLFQEHSEGSENAQLGEDREHVGSVSPDELCSLHQSAHKGDIIDRAGQNKAATFGALRAPPFPIAPILSHFMFTDYIPLPHCPIIPQ